VQGNILELIGIRFDRYFKRLTSEKEESKDGGYSIRIEISIHPLAR